MLTSIVGNSVHAKSITLLRGITKMESPHEHQQNLLLSRIVTNVEKLNEAVIVMNKSLQVNTTSPNNHEE
ncbi:uncharacterized protein G6M90_00g024480 [Metarhizium brunneum]|uniref:DASH complex subunit DAD4 n=1 Tax=Metarhizium brunneum TaxID=500148 RepID=A0A7D5UQZ6_9HYPO|nr:hypothetical protein G6M90_00g024480 [Metarhizium brunneum]